MALSVRPVGSERRLARSFVEVPFRLYAEDPRWVPPLRSEALKMLDRKKNPFFRHADVEHFVVFDGGTPVGRIAATVYPAYNERFGVQTGLFGFFESSPSEDVSRVLLQTAERWLAKRGMTTVAGPYNYVATHEMGLLVDGFGEPPCAFQTYNPRRYSAQIEAAGYRQAFTASTYKYTSNEVMKMLGPALDAGDRLLADGGFTTRMINKRRFREEMRLLREMLNESFATNSEITPYEAEVFEHMVMPLKHFVDERLIRFIERDGRPVAFTVMVPDVNMILARLGGKLRPQDLLKLGRMRREVNAAVLLIVGRLPSERGKGLGAGIVAQLAHGWVDAGYEHLHTTWIHDHNDPSLALARQFGNEPNKRFAVFERRLNA
jgi:hypothetical protein